MTFGRTRSSSTGRQFLLGIVVGLRATPVLELGCLGVERQELVENPVVQRQLDDRPAYRVAPHDVALLEQVV